MKRIEEAMAQVRTIQDKNELAGLCKHIELLKPNVILEIGVHYGGTINLWSKFVVGDDPLIIGVDISYDLTEKSVMNSGFKLVKGDSKDDITLAEVKRILSGREVDYLFIDGDHLYPSVMNDYVKFLPLVRSGGIIGFHDIVYQTKEAWTEIKLKHKIFEEFICTDHLGIGIVIKE